MAAPYITFGDLRQAVRDNLDEISDTSDSGFWTNARLGRIINRAIPYVWAEVRKLKHDYFMVARNSTDGIVTILGESYDTAAFQLGPTGGSSGNGRRYLLPPDFVELVEIRVSTASYERVRFTFLPQTHPVFQSFTGLDTAEGGFFYTISGARDLLVAPIPSVTLDLHIEYVPVLPTYAVDGTDDATDVVLPYPLHIVVEEVATWRAQMQDHDPMAGGWASVAQASVARFMGSAARASTDPGFVWSPFD